MKSLLFILLFCLPAQAYIPKFWMIMSRTAESHGKGIYRVQQDVVFTHSEESLVVHEDWLIENGEKMMVRVSGKDQLKNKVRFTIVYNGQKRTFIDENGARRNTKLPKDWFEHFFHFRFSKKIKPKMHAMKMIPSEGLGKPRPPRSIKEAVHKPESFVRLSRVGGNISYGIGTPTPSGQEGALPGLWVAQDQFNVLKLRLPSQTQVKANHYNKHTRGLYLPRSREVLWGNNKVVMNVTNVKSYGASKKLSGKISPRALDFGKDPTLGRIQPEDPIIREFYTFFR